MHQSPLFVVRDSFGNLKIQALDRLEAEKAQVPEAYSYSFTCDKPDLMEKNK